MTPLRGALARLDRSRDELAKAWLVRLIESASLDEIRELPTDRIARELPELITGIARSAAEPDGAGRHHLSHEQSERAAALARLRSGGREVSAAQVAGDVASLQTVLIRALREDLAGGDPDGFADAVESVVDATGAIQAAALEALVKGRSRELESQANTDPLTGLDNLRSLQRSLGRLIDEHRRYRHSFALILLDIDGLKRINDAHGHSAGDRVLMALAMVLRRSVRSVDVAARLGGDEFCVLAPQQDLASGAVLATRLAATVKDGVPSPDGASLGISLGVSACPEQGEEADALIDTADRAMYRAKAAGGGVALPLEQRLG